VVNRLAAETSPYLLQPEAALATPTIGGRAGLAGATAKAALATPTVGGRAGLAGATVQGVLQ
jgi:hypothetical protein